MEFVASRLLDRVSDLLAPARILDELKTAFHGQPQGRQVGCAEPHMIAVLRDGIILKGLGDGSFVASEMDGRREVQRDRLGTARPIQHDYGVLAVWHEDPFLDRRVGQGVAPHRDPAIEPKLDQLSYRSGPCLSLLRRLE